MKEIDHIRRICKILNASYKGTETKTSFLPSSQVHSARISINYLHSQYVIIAIPEEIIPALDNALSELTDPCDENYESRLQKRDLYYRDPYFKELWDSMNTYFQLRKSA